MSRLYDVMAKRWNAKATANAMQDPWYAETEATRGGSAVGGTPDTPGGVTKTWIDRDKGLTWDVWQRQRDIFDRLTKRPWWFNVHWWLQRHGYKAQRRNLRTFIERGHHGYARSDLWNFDSYLLDVISAGVTELRRVAHGHPAEISAEEWDRILTQIAAGMDAGRRIIVLEYVTDDGEVNAELEKVLHAEFDEAMDLLRRWFFGLWD